MPGGKFLDWAEIRDFSPGLVTQTDWLLGPSSAQQMDDCYPQQEGGLRAFMKPTGFSTSGVIDIAHEKVIGIFSRGGIALRSGSPGQASDRYLWTVSTSGHSVSGSTPQVRLYRWDETAVSPPTSWTMLKAFAAVNAVPNPVQGDVFIDSSAKTYVVFTLFQTSTDDGLWSIEYSAGTLTKQGTFKGPIGVQDDRIIVSDGNFTLHWSDSQSVSSYPAANNLPVQASRQGNIICSVSPFAPSDLFIGTEFSAWTMIQGSITDPIVRTMSDARSLGYFQKPPFTTEGLAFIGLNQSVFLTGNGEQFVDISKQLAPSTWSTSASNGDVGGGDLAYFNNLLFAPHGLIFDFRTRSWFKVSGLSTSDSFHAVAMKAPSLFSSVGEVFAATAGTSFALLVYPVNENASRASSYTWKSAPIRGQDGRQIRVREIQVYCKPYASGASMTVTCGAQSFTKPLRHSSGFQQESFLFNQLAEELDVTVTSQSNSSAEAPSIEVVRIGSRSAHRLP